MLPASNDIIHQNIVGNISEGIVTLRQDGTITYANPAAYSLLGFSEDEMLGRKPVEIFFNDPRNDDFIQLILDTVYQRSRVRSIVPYYQGERQLHLRVTTSFIEPRTKDVSVVIVFVDLSELMDLRDAMKSMNQISKLNEELKMRNKLISETFGRYLSDEIVRELLETPGGLALGGRKETLTVMMSDLRGFTALSEQMDAADLVQMLNHYLGIMTDIIQKRGGTIIEFIGDGIMAIFGAPVSSPEHASQAAAAAVEMEAAMEEVNEWNISHGYPALAMGIGVHTGDVIIGNIGSEKRTKFGVVGNNVNLCGRIESYTGAGQILISPDTRSSISADLEVARELRVMPKGASHEMLLSQITGIGSPYNISARTENSKMKKPEKVIPVCFHRVNEKRELERVYYGGILEVGSDCARLDTGVELQLFDNIVFEAGGKVFCKILEKQEETYLLQYTSIPSGYTRWYQNALGITQDHDPQRNHVKGGK